MLRSQTGRGAAHPPAALAAKALALLAAGLLAWWAGSAVAVGGWQLGVALGMAALALLLPIVRAVIGPYLHNGFLAVEVPLLAMLLSTLVWRQRSAQNLLSDPLDSAGKFRVALVALGVLLSAIALLSPVHEDLRTSQRATTRPFRLYGAYTLVAIAGAALSLHPILTLYRGLELVAALVVLLGAWRTLGNQAAGRVEAVLYLFTVAVVGSVWLGVLLFPGDAIGTITRGSAPVRWYIQGVYPFMSANGVGLFGLVLAVWTLGRLHSARPPGPRPWVAYLLLALGTLTVLAAQYRTGYVALALAVAVELVLRRRWGLATLLVLVAVGALLWSPGVIETVQPYVLRGSSTAEVKGLDSRVEYWSTALGVWRQSPLIGRGLLTGTRFEALSRLNLDFTSSIHGSWVEALVGTGLVGVTLLGASFLMTFRRAVVSARRGAWVVPLLLLTAVAVRSVTGPSIESFSPTAMVFLWIALSLPDRPYAATPTSADRYATPARQGTEEPGEP